ncbi:MAG: hypothetical protein JW995_14180 [Melioribacteraceae bacterium]|nr:hypothetical protein [Melioribacteraceae bacterium]
MSKVLKILLVIFSAATIISCTDKFDAPDNTISDPANQIIGDTLYIQQYPVWAGFNYPQDMIVGREPLLYIADTDNDRIVMMDISGRIQGSRSIKRPVALAQDYKLNLIVCAEFDTTINGISNTYSAVFKINLFEGGHDFSSAPAKRLLPKTAYDFDRPGRKYTGACVFYNNMFYISRTGTVNSSPVDPDNSILIFSNYERRGVERDTLIGRVPMIEPLGSGVVSANILSSLTSFNRISLDIITTLKGENSFKVQYLQYIQTPLFSGYISRLSPFTNELMSLNKFSQPEGTALDIFDNIYVADAAKDSVFKFNNFGDEMESFGGSEIMSRPHAVAYHDKTLYVLDTGNNRILRFILSTEID